MAKVKQKKLIKRPSEGKQQKFKSKMEKDMNQTLRWPNTGQAATGGAGAANRPYFQPFMPGANFGREIPRQKQRSQFQTIGDTGLEIFGGFVHDEFLNELQGLRGMQVYDQMRKNDAVIGAMLFVSKQLIQNASLLIRPNSKARSKRKAQQWAEFVEECFYDMDRSWPDVLDEILTMFEFGFTYSNVVFKKRQGYKPNNNEKSSMYNDNKIGFAKIASRSQLSLNRWILSDTGAVLGMEQTAPPTYTRSIIPIGNAAHFRTNAERGNPEGQSVLRRCFRAYHIKKNLEETEGIGVERDLTGLPVLIAPEGLDLWNTNDAQASATLTRAENIVRLIRLDKFHGLVLPNGWEFQLVTTPGQRAHNTLEIISRWDQRIAVTLLADMLLIGHERVGSFALVQSKSKLLSSALESYAKRIAGEFNRRVIPRLMILNNAPQEYWPKMEFGPVETPSLVDLAEYIKALSDVGINLSDEQIAAYLRNVGGLPAAKNKKDLLQTKPEDQQGNQHPGEQPNVEENNDESLDITHRPESGDDGNGED